MQNWMVVWNPSERTRKSPRPKNHTTPPPPPTTATTSTTAAATTTNNNRQKPTTANNNRQQPTASNNNHNNNMMPAYFWACRLNCSEWRFPASCIIHWCLCERCWYADLLVFEFRIIQVYMIFYHLSVQYKHCIHSVICTYTGMGGRTSQDPWGSSTLPSTNVLSGILNLLPHIFPTLHSVSAMAGNARSEKCRKGILPKSKTTLPSIQPKSTIWHQKTSHFGASCKLVYWQFKIRPGFCWMIHQKLVFHRICFFWISFDCDCDGSGSWHAIQRVIESSSNRNFELLSQQM